jgi:NAD(P)-dependent dehydrogenase (short-subunit alcohol dehydrogenase family)
MRLRDRMAVVTGAGGSLGQGICLGLAREGAHIVASDLNLELAEDTVAKVRETGRSAVRRRARQAGSRRC